MAEGDMDGFLTSLKNAIDRLKTLEIVTAVGPLGWKVDEGAYRPVPGADVKAIKTTIDLVDGDVSTQMDPEFVTGDLQALREYHRQTELQGHEIVVKNIKALKALFDLALHYKHST